MSTPLRVRVVPLQHGLGALDYADPLGLAPGDIVIVPLGARTILGVVWEGEHAPARAIDDGRLKPVTARVEGYRVATPLRRLIDWVAAYYIAPTSAVLRMALSSPAALEAPRATTEYRVKTAAPPPATAARRAALARIADSVGSVRALAAAAGVSDAMVRALITAGALEAVSTAPPAPRHPDPAHAPPALEAGQAEAAAAIAGAVAAGGFRPFLLEGVTGSGKTEVYCEGIAAALRAGGQALVLLPEIALTQAFIERFAARFGVPPILWHSGLKSSERRANWRAVADGGPQVVVGARSALFLPFPALRLLVVDEAHEPSFKQEDGVSYHGRDTAVMRARFEDAAIVLASATPALEMLAQVETGRYRHLLLKARYGGAALPAVAAVDLRRHPPPRGRWLSPPLVAAVEETMAAGEQALLFLNRRGYAPLTLCRTCGERLGCPNCSAWLVEHRLLGRLMCHHCGHTLPTPPACPACGAPGSLAACGPGVERIAEEAARLFPRARIAIVTSDTVGTPARAAALVAAMEAREIDVLIGTQLVTKGYHFPALTLVGIVDADLGLQGGDLRAAERTFAQIAQAGGRAGRAAARPGRVLIQTFDPAAAVLRALVSGDAAAFRAAEAAARRELGMPPYGRLAAIIVSDPDAARAEATARALGLARPIVEGLRVLGPAPAPLAQLRGRHRWRLLVEARRSVDLQRAVRGWLATVPVRGQTRVAVDVDPHSFL